MKIDKTDSLTVEQEEYVYPFKKENKKCLNRYSCEMRTYLAIDNIKRVMKLMILQKKFYKEKFRIHEKEYKRSIREATSDDSHQIVEYRSYLRKVLNSCIYTINSIESNLRHSQHVYNRINLGKRKGVIITRPNKKLCRSKLKAICEFYNIEHEIDSVMEDQIQEIKFYTQ